MSYGYNRSDYAYGNRGKLTDFPDPFVTYSSTVYPDTISDVFNWADWLWQRNGVYTQSIKRSIRYFLNGINLRAPDDKGLDHATRRKYEKFLVQQLNIMDTLASIGDDVIGYGNSFSSVSVPITRNIICPECSLSRRLDSMRPEKDYKWENWSFIGACPECSYRGAFKRIDSNRIDRDSNIRVIRWAPQYISIKHCPLTGDSDYFYRIPTRDKEAIESGDPVYLRSVPWEYIKAVKEARDFKFNKETFIHLSCGSSAAVTDRLKGWGLPLFMCNFSQVVHLQILERFTEAIAMDYIMPFRVVTPPQKQAGTTGDPMLSNNMNNFMGNVRQMIREHRFDPTTWHTLPYPLEYQALGGEAKSLVPVELLDRALDNLLTSMGIPQEFYRSSIQISGGPPVSLRMFEKSWTHNTVLLDDWLNWFLSQCSRLMNWEQVHGSLVRTSVLEDDTTKQVKLNLASAGVISNTTALKAFGIDADEERDLMLEEQAKMNAELSAEQKKEEKRQMLSEAMPVTPPAIPGAGTGMAPGQIPPGAMGANMGAAPPAGGGGAPMPPVSSGMGMSGGGAGSLDEVMAQAEQMAQQLLSMPPYDRRKELTNLKSSNPSLHAQVKQLMEDMKQSIGSQAVSQATGTGGQQM
jgi:hypothetical protein